MKGSGAHHKAPGVEYTAPQKDTTPHVNLQPPQPSWWDKRKAERAVRKAAREAAATTNVQEAHLLKIDLQPDSVTSVVRPIARHIPLPPRHAVAHPRPTPPPIPAPHARAQTRVDFISDAGFHATRTPPPPKKHGIPLQPGAVTPGALLDVNLIPKGLGDPVQQAHKPLSLLWYALGALVCVVGAYGGLRWYEYSLTAKASIVQAEVAQLDRQIAIFTAERVQAERLQTQLTGVQSILDQHVSYGHFFQWLEENTLQSVYYQALNVDAALGEVNGQAVTHSFEQLRAQVAVWKANPLVQEVTVTSATRTVPTSVATVETSENDADESVPDLQPITFGLTVLLNPDVFQANYAGE